MFSNAKTFVKDTAAPRSKSREIEVEGIREIGALKLIVENLKSVQTTLTDELKSWALSEVFLKEGRASGVVPSNFRAIEGDSHGSVQLRPKSSTSPLKEEEVELLNQHEIPFTVKVDGVETFIINPAYADNMELLGQIEAALSKVKGLPADLFMKQEAKKTNIVSEATLPAIFKLAATKVGETFKIDFATFRALIGSATAPAVTPNFGDTDLKKALSVVSDLVDLTVEARKETTTAKGGNGLMDALKASVAASPKKGKANKAA